MKKPESEVEESQGPAVGSIMDCDHHNVEKEAEMILMHGQMGPSSMEMEKDMEMPMKEKY